MKLWKLSRNLFLKGQKDRPIKSALTLFSIGIFKSWLHDFEKSLIILNILLWRQAKRVVNKPANYSSVFLICISIATQGLHLKVSSLCLQNVSLHYLVFVEMLNPTSHFPFWISKDGVRMLSDKNWIMWTLASNQSALFGHSKGISTVLQPSGKYFHCFQSSFLMTLN